MADKIDHIRDSFPDKRHIIDYLLSVDPEFLSLCEDHDACVYALRYWSESSSPEAQTRHDEYRILIQELREEIATVINKVDMK